MLAAFVMMLALTAYVTTSAEAKKKKKNTAKSSTKTTVPKSDVKPPKTIAEVAGVTPEFKTFNDLVKSAGMTETLKGTGPYTVFAPTDEAFAKMPKEQLEGIKSDPVKLKSFLSAHIVSGNVAAAAAAKQGKVKDLNGQEDVVHQEGKMEMVGEAKITKADIPASNGVIHQIDTVLAK